MSQRIYIIGLPGVGKSTLGKELSSRLNIPFVDLDNYIESVQEQTIPTLFKEAGEDGFRNIEAHALRSYTQLNNNFIMACGGGTPCGHGNMDLMLKNGITIYYTKPITAIANQLLGDENIRPLLKNTKPEDLPLYLNNLLNKREPYYLKANIISDSLDSIIAAINSLVPQAQ